MAGPGAPGPIRLVHWSASAVVGVALISLAAGFGQFGAVAALGDVAKSFGHPVAGLSVGDQAGLSGTELGIGLSVLRIASLAALPLTILADRIGRRRVLLTCCALGLAATVLASASPSYWWFVAIFALGRPLLSATNALGQVVVAEETAAVDRARAIALVTGGYGVGSGLTALLHGAASGVLGFRGLFLLAALPLLLLPLIGRLVVEPDRFLAEQRREARASGAARTAASRGIPAGLRGRLVLVAAIAFAVALTSGPATGFVYLDAQDIAKLPGWLVSVMVLAAGALGLLGLLAGRWAADRVGRRPTGAIAMIAVALVSILTYSGSHGALVVGYAVGVFAASVLAPTAGSFVNELFPTSIRARVAGWLVVASVLGAVVGLVEFGAVANGGRSFAVAAAVTFLPTAAASVLFAALPETRGLEPEDIEGSGGGPARGHVIRPGSSSC